MADHPNGVFARYLHEPGVQSIDCSIAFARLKALKNQTFDTPDIVQYGQQCLLYVALVLRELSSIHGSVEDHIPRGEAWSEQFLDFDAITERQRS